MKKLILSVLLSISAIISFAQNPTKSLKSDLIPPSPTAGSIAKAAEVPVNLSTGLPSLSIPIFIMQGNDLSLPVSLTYNFDGFRPAQASSWAGLGWNLDAGGVITRNIKGVVDGTAGPAGAFQGNGNFDEPFVKSNINNFNMSDDFIRGVAAGAYDAEPDIYSFSFPGYSGKFIKYGDKYYVMPNQKLQVTGGGSSFLIVTEDGTRYLFAETEYTEPKSQGGSYNLPSHTSAWYLTKIQNASQTEAITLTYQAEGKITNAGAFSQTYKKPFTLQDGSLGNPSSSFPTFVYPKRLTSITTDKFVMTIDAAEDRLDINQSAGGSAKGLKGISVSSRYGSFSKYFKFNQSYFGTGYNVYLKLNSLQEYVTGSVDGIGKANDTLTHKFDYVDIANAPNRNHAFVDHYGFYKGGEFTNMLIPKVYHANGVNRDPDLNTTVQGALKKITYPSGGNTVFEYESNVAFDGMNYQEHRINKEATVTRPSNNQNSSYSGYGKDPIVLSEAKNIDVYVVRAARSPYADNFTRNIDPDFVITDASGNVVFQGVVALESENAGKTFTKYLQPGTYSLQVSIDSRETGMSANVSYTAQSTTPIEGKLVGGLRLKQSITNPLIGHSLKREYKYTTEAGFSSGTAPNTTYDQIGWTDVHCRPNGNDAYDFNIISSYISENYASYGSHHYTTVLEKQISGSEILFTRNDFESYNNYFMGVVPTKITHYKGSDINSLVPVSLKEYEYGLDVDTNFTALKAYQNMVVIFEGCNGYDGPTEGYGFSTYGYAQAWKYLKNTKTTRYEHGKAIVSLAENHYDSNRNLVSTKYVGSDGASKISRFKYPESYTSSINQRFLNAHVLSPIFEQQTWTRKGTDSVLVDMEVTGYNDQNFKPQVKYLIPNAGISSLNSESKIGGKYSSLLSDTRLKPEINFSYNSLGRLTQQQIVNGIPVSYAWAYPKMTQNYPIAEVQNAIESEFYLENFEESSGSANSSLNVHTGNYCNKGSFYLPYTPPNTKDYVVSFFYREGGSWKYRQMDYDGPLTLSYGDAIDDVAVYPKDARLTSYIYNPGLGLVAAIDAKGLTTSFTYDQFGRLEFVKDQKANILTQNRYSYGRGGFFSVAKSAIFTKNNCSTGLLGSTVTYSIPAGTYTSITSQQDADQQATDALAAGGQAYANANGSCHAKAIFSFVNNTTYNPGTSSHSAQLNAVYFKDLNGNTLYSFLGGQISAGFSLPQGVYNIQFEIGGATYNFNDDLGWQNCILEFSGATKGVDSGQPAPFVLSDVDLRGVGTAVINLNKGGMAIE